MNTHAYEIQYVARRTGLNPHRIRAWERRYKAVMPERTATRRRVYSESDVRRLQLLRRAIENGHRISQIGRMPLDDLLILANPYPVSLTPPPPVEDGQRAAGAADYVRSGFRAVSDLDSKALERVLMRSLVHFPPRCMIDTIIAPLMRKVGDAWVKGTLRIAHEHMASAVIRTFLGALLREVEGMEGGASIVIATPRGQRHDLGALSAALTASDAGWQPLYLGSSLPADEIAAAVAQNEARAAAISVACSTNGDQLREECVKLRQLLEGELPFFVGGQAPDAFRNTLADIKVRWCESLDEFHMDLVNELPSDPERTP